MDLTEPATTYGNPATKSYKKQHIRLAVAAGTSALVNKDILDIAAAFLTAAVADAPRTGLPDRITAWVPLPAGADPGPEHYGLTLPATIAAPDLAAAYGFETLGDYYVFTGNIADVQAAAVAAETASVLLLVGPEMDPNRPHSEWSTDRPGMREPGPGDKGDDVHFFQLLYSCPDQNGVMTEFDTALIRELQRRWGLTITGTITPETWGMLLPNARNYQLDYGDINQTVKILQAALVAYDWTDGNLPVTGRFDQPTTRALSSVQETYGLRNHPACGAPEWAAILGRWPV